MRELLPAPATLFAPGSTEPQLGAFRGGLPRVDLTPLSRERLHTLLHRKRWMYLAIASDEVLVALAVVDLGYAASSFAYVFERASGRLLVDRSSMAPSLGELVNERAGEGHASRFRSLGTEVQITHAPGTGHYAVDAHYRGLRLWVQLETAHAPPALSVVMPIGSTRTGSLASTTEKRPLLHTRGDVTVNGKRFSLDGALAGYDYTHGLLARHTAWKWAFGLGRSREGARVAFNLTEGFVGERECAVWVDDELFGLGAARFEFDPRHPLAPWRVRTEDERVNLAFAPSALHAEHKNLGLIATRFVQPVGVWSGQIRLPGRTLQLENVLGVAEDQDARW
jgi:hypothetical protein